MITSLGRNIPAGYQPLADGLILPRDAKGAVKQPIF